MKYSVRPISDRTEFTGDHKNSPFGISYGTLMNEFDRELWFLNAENVVLEVDVDERHIRNDGMLRADAKTRTPAVRLAFDSDQGPLIYATDVFVKPSWKRNVMTQDWHHNLCAIVRGLEALRKIDRYEITKRGEQYAGWKALPSNGSAASPEPEPMSVEEAWAILGSYGDGTIRAQRDRAPEGLAKAWRRARAANHPDRRGDRLLWDQVEEAARVLGVAK